MFCSSQVVGVKIQWQMLSGMIVPASCVQPGGDIEYIRFLNEFESMKVPDNDSDAGIGQDEEEINYHIVESVYVQVQALRSIRPLYHCLFTLSLLGT
jgi:hypothetical protein